MGDILTGIEDSISRYYEKNARQPKFIVLSPTEREAVKQSAGFQFDSELKTLDDIEILKSEEVLLPKYLEE